MIKRMSFRNLINKKILKYCGVEEKVRLYADEILRNENFHPINFTDKNDVFIASYPKSGNTWMQNMISSMLLNSTTNISPRLVSEIVPDVHARKYYKRIFNTMFFKTHSKPKPEYKKVIHLVRDGRDVIVSLYHYLKLNNNKGVSLDKLINEQDSFWSGKWHEHTAAWRDNPYNAKIITVRYEDLVTNGVEELKKIASFLELGLDIEEIRTIYDHNNIDKIREKVVTEGWDYDSRFGKDSKNFFRNGRIGDFRKELSTKQIEDFNAISEKTLRAYGYEI